MPDCLFCRIIKKEIPSELVHEDEICVAFRDIKPQAPVHLLIVPHKHILSIAHLEEGDEEIIAHLIKTAKDLAKRHNLEGYQLRFFVGEKGGQVIFHVHLHLLGGEAKA